MEEEEPEEEVPVAFPYLEETPTEQVLHTEKFIIPLANVGYELLQNPKNDWWYLKNESLKIRPIYVEQFENKSKTRVKRNYSLPGYCLVQNIFLQMTCIVYSTKLYRVLPCNEEMQLRPIKHGLKRKKLTPLG